MNMLSDETVKELSEQHGWTPTYIDGYINGKRARSNSQAPSTFLLIGIDEYCLGYRAGYYSADRARRGTKEIQE